MKYVAKRRKYQAERKNLIKPVVNLASKSNHHKHMIEKSEDGYCQTEIRIYVGSFDRCIQVLHQQFDLTPQAPKEASAASVTSVRPPSQYIPYELYSNTVILHWISQDYTGYSYLVPPNPNPGHAHGRKNVKGQAKKLKSINFQQSTLIDIEQSMTNDND